MNHLATQTSPYLRQHADNPVDWHPWDQASLDLARTQNKPILLSIGYSACHWCHVMAHESFEDNDTARLMNEHFINIKVDREERPDLDKVYQLAHQVLTQRGGGWPLTVFLSPDNLIPFFAGTYFPREARYQLPAFGELLNLLHEFYIGNTDDIEQQNQQLLDAFTSLGPQPPNHDDILDNKPLDIARHQYQKIFNKVNGGFDTAPKFPHPGHIETLLNHYCTTIKSGHPDEHALHMATHSLIKMSDGGINDQLGGGFYRYSVDEQWAIPHFEKMLYDNAQLLSCYARAYAITNNSHFKDTVLNTAQWVMNDMQADDGGYYASLDADTAEGEGDYYVWDRKEIEDILNDEVKFTLISQHFGLDQAANFEGRWHLHIQTPIDALLHIDEDSSLETIKADIESAKQQLLAKRTQRSSPARDEKIICSWNALMIRGMTIAARHCDQPTLFDSALRALNFIHTHLWQDNHLRVSYKSGKAPLNAYLDDYAFLIDALIEVLQMRWNNDYIDFACTLADKLINDFEDTEHGGFFYTANDHEQLFHRPKSFGDEAIPSGNGIAAYALLRLGHLMGEPRYIDAATRAIKAAWTHIADLPYAHASFLGALDEALTPPQIIILRGAADQLVQWQAHCQQAEHPHRLCFALPDDQANYPTCFDQHHSDAPVTAFICEGTQCLAPITDLDTFKQQLQ